jgi:steroid delta-isomerase-like uncharacterized protein
MSTSRKHLNSATPEKALESFGMYPTVIHEWFDQIWNKGHQDAVHRLLTPDGVIHGLAQDGSAATGPEAFLAFYSKFRAAFSDLHITVLDTVTEGEIVASRWHCTANHTGDSLGFAPTGSAVAFSGMTMARLSNGRIVEGWNIWDAAALNAQLGFQIVPPARGATSA